MSSSVEMPPEATTGNPATLATERYASTSMPVCMPSRAISVNTRCLNPSEASSDTTSVATAPNTVAPAVDLDLPVAGSDVCNEQLSKSTRCDLGKPGFSDQDGAEGDALGTRRGELVDACEGADAAADVDR